MNTINTKLYRLIFLLFLLLAILSGMIITNYIKLGLLGTIIGPFFGLVFNKLIKAAEDVSDNTNWQVSLRKRLRGGYIKKDTSVRISFAYLFRIKIDDKYLLIKNSRGTDKYQPVGGVYKYSKEERIALANTFHIIDDDKIPLDSKSQFDYRLKLSSKYLKKFIKRFDSFKSSRERIDNISREFKEELGAILNWDSIQYRYCGRYYSELEYSNHFQCYELQLADIVELIPNDSQMIELKKVFNRRNSNFMLATSSEIKELGVITGTNKLKERIADHTINILQEKEDSLTKIKGIGEIYNVKL